MTKRLTAAEKQRNYRERQDARRNEDAGLAAAARGIVYWLERAAEQGVTLVTLPVASAKEPRDFHATLKALELEIATVTEQTKKQKAGSGITATNGTHVPSSSAPLQETVKHKRTRSATVKKLKAHVQQKA